MKAFLKFLLLPGLISPGVELIAQRMPDGAFEKKIILVDAHTSLGSFRGRDFATQRIPVFIGADYGVANQLSAGIFVGWNQRTYKDAGLPAYDVNHYYYGLRVKLHLTDWLSRHTIFTFNTEKTDLYASFFAGRVSSKGVGFTPTLGFTTTENIVGGMIGFRYFTMYRIGLLVECGAGPYGVLNLGICSRF